ncbi:hypothetical protein ACHAXT_007911 [Thalassiosira profunda]
MPGEPPQPGYRRIHTAPTQGSLDAFLCSRNGAKNGRGADPPARQVSARRRRRRTVEVEGSADAQRKGREQTTCRARQQPQKMKERSGNAKRVEQRQHKGQLRTEKRHNKHQSHKCQSSRRKPIEPEEDIVLASSAQPSVLVDAGHPSLLVEDSGQVASTPPQRRQPPQQRRASGERIHQPSSGRKKRTGSSNDDNNSSPDRNVNSCRERPSVRTHRRRSTAGTEPSTERSASHEKRRGDSERKGHGSSFDSSSCTLDGACDGGDVNTLNSADDLCKAQSPVSPVASFLQRAHAKATTPTKKQHTKSEIVYVRNQLQQIKQQREVIHQRAEDAGIKDERTEGGGSFHLDESGREHVRSSSQGCERSGFGNNNSSMWISDLESLQLSDIEGLKRSSC